MPQVDLGTLLRVGSGGSNGGGDGRVTCETLLHLSEGDNNSLPAESFLLSKQDELDWFDRNVFYERKESTKGNSNPSRVVRSNSNPNSQRLSISTKSKPSIIGLPKPQPATFPDSKHRRNVKSSKIRFFPKRLGSAGKFSLKLNEPSSPKVSCMGRVRSRDRSSKKKKTSSSSSTTPSTKPEKTGFWSSLKNFFSFRRKKPIDGGDTSEKSQHQKEVTDKNISLEFEEEGSGVNPNPNPPGLGGLNRFVSGRRSDCWAGDVVVDVDLQKDDRHSSF